MASPPHSSLGVMRLPQRALCDSAMVRGVGKAGASFKPAAGYGFDPLAEAAGTQLLTMVNGYWPGGFIVNGERLHGAVLLLPESRLPLSALRVSELDIEALKVLKPHAPLELLVIGCGPKVERLPAEVAEYLRGEGIATELVSARTACATYNFMLQEKRLVAALLFPLDPRAAAQVDLQMPE